MTVHLYEMKAKKNTRSSGRPADIQTAIREILYQDWNPSGLEDLMPEDVQAHYILPILRIIVGSRSEKEMLEFLHRTGSGFGGIAADASAENEHLRPVARKLLKLKVS
jgi:hypothetical protein